MLFSSIFGVFSCKIKRPIKILPVANIGLIYHVGLHGPTFRSVAVVPVFAFSGLTYNTGHFSSKVRRHILDQR